MADSTMDLSDLTSGTLSAVDQDAAILIAGPPMTGKYELFLRLLIHQADTLLVISTKNGHERIRTDIERVGGAADPDHLKIVDCVSYHRPGPAEGTDGSVQFAESPENLTRIGVKFTELFEPWQEDPSNPTVGVGIHSLSQLLMHSEVKKVYQFLQVLVGQIRNASCFVAAVVDVTDGDDQTVQTLQQHFDGLIETREGEDGTRELRLRGLGQSSSSWTAF